MPLLSPIAAIFRFTAIAGIMRTLSIDADATDYYLHYAIRRFRYAMSCCRPCRLLNKTPTL